MVALHDIAPAERPGLPPDAPELPGLTEPNPPATPKLSREEFDWFKDEAVIVERQPSIAVYRNPRDHVVIRAESESHDEDAFIFLATDQAIKALIAALQRELREGGR